MRLLILVCFAIFFNGQALKTNDNGQFIKSALMYSVKASSEQLIEKNFPYLFSDLPVVLNAAVKQEILELLKMKSHLNKLFGKGEYFFPDIELGLTYQEVPKALKFIAVVESSLNPLIKSPYGNAGFWQFNEGTARSCGLQVNENIDERLDPRRATKAAGHYLNILYDKYQDWWLALAAYNCGPKRIDTALKSAADYDYWSIRPSLPKITQDYIPHIIALIYLEHFMDDHGIVPEYFDMNMEYGEETLINGSFDLKAICEDYFLAPEDVKRMNPFLLKERFETGPEGLLLRIPGELPPPVAINVPVVEEASPSRQIEIIPPLLGSIKVKSISFTK